MLSVGNITIKASNPQLERMLAREARRRHRRYQRPDIEALIDRHCAEIEKRVIPAVKVSVRVNADFSKKLACLKELYRGRRFRRRDANGLLRLSEIEKQILHHIYGIDFRTLNQFRAQAWSQIKRRHKLVAFLRGDELDR